MSHPIYIGVDLGGTSIKTGICDREGNLLKTIETPTDAEQGTDQVIANIAASARSVVDESEFAWEQVEGIGMGIPGFMDVEEGFMKLSPNLPLTNVPLKRLLEEKLGKTIYMGNDANVAALGEAWSGAGKGVPILVMYTLGTGVGGGIIINGDILIGSSGMGGELGHMAVVPDLEAIQCGCGKLGCLETVSSATGIIRMAKDAVGRGDRTMLADVAHIMAKDVFDAARAGDETALRIVNRAAFYLGKSLATISVVINPNRFVIGGGVSKAGELILAPVREVFKQFAQAKAQEGVEIVAATLGNDAGMIGAAGLCIRK
jgi:glucokinase